MTGTSKLTFLAKLNTLPISSVEVDHEPPKLSERSHPIKKRRINFGRHQATYPIDEDEILKSTGQIHEEITECVEDVCMKDDTDLICAEVEVGTKFACGYDAIANFTHNIMPGLEIRQRYYRQEPQSKLFKERAKKLLDESWEFTVKMMIDSFKRGLSCVNCQEHHETRDLFKKIDTLGKKLMGVDSSEVNQKKLIEFEEHACRIGEEYLKAVQETECQNIRRIWSQETASEGKGKVCRDSGVEIGMPCKLMGLPEK